MSARQTLRGLVLALVVGATPAWATEPVAPRLDVEFAVTETVPGQFLTLQLTVLVPTWMTEPVAFPSLEVPNVRVRLGERSTRPVSRRIAGSTWAGVSRRYLVSPMIPGTFRLPAAEVLVTYASPEGREPVRRVLQTPVLRFSGLVPEGAEGLEPFIAARGLTISQQIEGEPAALRPGDSVIRIVSVRVKGLSPMFLPTLLPVEAPAGMRAYVASPKVEPDPGEESGSRTERVTLMAESPGTDTVPAVVLRWYDLDTGEIAESSVAGFRVSIEGPAITSDPTAPGANRWLGAGAAVTVLLVLGWYLVPRLRRWLARRKAARLASERWARKELLRAVARRDFAGTQHALDRWAYRLPGGDPRADATVVRALLDIGAERYGHGTGGAADSAWRQLERSVKRYQNLGSAQVDVPLAPLNPV